LRPRDLFYLKHKLLGHQNIMVELCKIINFFLELQAHKFEIHITHSLIFGFVKKKHSQYIILSSA
jgi:hypothetical protein